MNPNEGRFGFYGLYITSSLLHILTLLGYVLVMWISFATGKQSAYLWHLMAVGYFFGSRVVALRCSPQGFVVPRYRRNQVFLALTLTAIVALFPAVFVFSGWHGYGTALGMCLTVIGIFWIGLLAAPRALLVVFCLALVTNPPAPWAINGGVATWFSPLSIPVGMALLFFWWRMFESREFMVRRASFWLTEGGSARTNQLLGVEFAFRNTVLLDSPVGRILAIALGLRYGTALMFLAMAVVFIAETHYTLHPTTLYPITSFLAAMLVFRWSTPELEAIWMMTGARSKWSFMVEMAIGTTLKTVLAAAIAGIPYFIMAQDWHPVLARIVEIALWMGTLKMAQIPRFVWFVGAIAGAQAIVFVHSSVFAYAIPLLWFLAVAWYIWGMESRSRSLVALP